MLELVGRYRIQERIGEGAMADVYRAHDPSINRTLAIKVLKAEFRQNKEYSARFLREAKAAGALSHPNIVTIYDVGEIDGYPYILMEFLDGEPLNEVMGREGALTADRVMSIGLQLAEALRYAHALGVVHRDIKPSNVMLDAKGQIKLLDFGIARMTEVEGLLEADSLKTQVGQVLGTPRYMSPEQALGQPLDGRSDLFSVGVILYELLTGKRAFGGGSAATLALQITQQDPPPIATLVPESPRGLQFIISKLLAKRSERRFSDGAQLADAIRREQAVYDAVQAEAVASRQRYLPLQLRLTLMLGAITAVVLVGAIGTVLQRQYQALEQMAITSGSAVTSFVASNASLSAAENATLAPADRDWLPVMAFVKVASEDPNVEQMMVVDSDGVVRAASDPALVGQPHQPPTEQPRARSAGDITITDARLADGEAFRFVKPITYAGRPVGRVDVSLSKRELHSTVLLTRSLMIVLGLVILAVILASTYALSRMLTAPIRRLKAAFAETAKGNLDFRISHSRRDEFGELFEGFNRFTQHVQDRLDSVESVALGSAVEDMTRVEPERPPVRTRDPSIAASPFDAQAEAAQAASEPQAGPPAAAPPVVTEDDPILPAASGSAAPPEPPPAPDVGGKTVVQPDPPAPPPPSRGEGLWPSDEDPSIIRRRQPPRE